MPRRAPEEKKKREERSPSELEIEKTTGGGLLFGGEGKYKRVARGTRGNEPSERRGAQLDVESASGGATWTAQLDMRRG